ncbi:hypothetical protein [Sinomicrobium weinanense]|uniref:Uncharacterized protein n=1 Tax=Sinomicrobium weinanense TaxID=2842200 RepID=A0A926JR07_9FLAO|nr:hypothetical protein [Sinomicrobium weinanense]MBC9795902.1 hypothetical protein [Sinomicrobium weinanense]MBU3124719.1 hypothetical protein [Sinomicrobium weinanense]
MEIFVLQVKENESRAVRKKIEGFSSSGHLYLHPGFPFYYTDGVQYAIALFEDGRLFLDMAMWAFALSRETDFIVIRLCRGEKGDCWLEFCKRNREVLKRARISRNIPLEPGVCMCFYFIGRTLLLPNEF